MSSPVRALFAGLVATFAASGLAATAARADAVADFYRGKTITVYIGSTAGGTYDLYARTVARHLGAHLPGTPTVIVQNMPGAASLVAAGFVYNAAPQDGTAIASLASTLPFQPLIDPVAAKQIDPVKVNWLPSPASYGVVMLVRGDLPVKGVDDMKNHEVVMATISPGMLPAVLAATTNATLGTKIKSINGHPDLASSLLAVDRGEIDGYPTVPYDAIKRAYAQKFAEGKYRVVLQFGSYKSPDFPDAPLITDLVTKPEDRMLLDLVMGSLNIGYGFMMGPKVPKERVAAMRQAFMDVFKDPAFLDDAQKTTLTIAPVDGEKIEALVKRAYSMPPAVIERMRAIYGQGR
jgi:tripartite-type tricarboxylate transporter receptor subunit TctC